MLQINDLEVRYGRLVAVRSLSLHVEQGEIVGLIGPNGAGKTSTIFATAGVIPAARGTILFEGRPITGMRPEAIVRRGIAVIPEGRRIFARLTVEQNIRLAAVTRSDPRVDSDIDDLLQRFPALARYRGSPAGKLSGGEQQQLAIARALVCRPRLLLMDEPSLGLAPLMVNVVFALVAELQQEGITTLLVEQNARRTLAVASRTYVMQGGRIRLESTPTTTIAEVEDQYFGSQAARP
jgi:branched-chain amino acid transport system ATP-binding protein